MVWWHQAYWLLKHRHRLAWKLTELAAQKKAVDEATAEVQDAKMSREDLATKPKGCLLPIRTQKLKSLQRFFCFFENASASLQYACI